MSLLRKAKRAYADGGVRTVTYRASRRFLPRPFDRYFWLLRKELADGRVPTVPVTDRIRLFLRGFRSNVYYLYGFDQTDEWDLYLSCTSRMFDTETINKSWEDLKNKAAFHELMAEAGFGEYCPTIFGRIENGVYTGSYNSLMDLLKQESRIVIKGVTGSGGKNVHIVTRTDNAIRMDGEELTEAEFEVTVSEFSESIVESYCDQCHLFNSLYPNSVNTIRLLTMVPSDCDPFLATGEMRIGTSESGHVDNFDSGGLVAGIDLNEGELGKAVKKLPNHQVHYHERHPDTGEQIEGVKIPNWDQIKEQLLTIAGSVPRLSYVGWDIVVMPHGEFIILEANHRPGVKGLQTHGPLLADQCVREFYQEHDVV